MAVASHRAAPSRVARTDLPAAALTAALSVPAVSRLVAGRVVLLDTLIRMASTGLAAIQRRDAAPLAGTIGPVARADLRGLAKALVPIDRFPLTVGTDTVAVTVSERPRRRGGDGTTVDVAVRHGADWTALLLVEVALTPGPRAWHAQVLAVTEP